jgi:hypothetical protein
MGRSHRQPKSTAEPSPELSGFALASRRVIGWTTNLLATGIVLVLALGMGRELVRWWGVGSQPPAMSADPNPAGSQVDPQSLEFGHGDYSLTRQSLAGAREAALGRLRELCREALAADAAGLSPPTASETAFLQRTASREPLEEQPGRWQLHYFEDAFPLLVGVRNAPAEVRPGGRDPPVEHRPDAGATGLADRARSGGSQRRVLAWGLAVPAGENEWSLYTYRAARPAGSSAEPGRTTPDPLGSRKLLADVQLPTGARRTLALRGQPGEATIGFTGRGLPETWRKELDAWFAAQGWQSDGWRSINSGWHAHYRHPVSSDAAQVHFADSAGVLTGLITLEKEINR